ncbi:hypothetical protein T458_04275 [Brevibacillus panacihumi W25]|uniref:Uncharacterized protein n=1 Tax=Brevibacillus panacihumi W25 TaxID=1408254 RepID=V6MLZ3_9BACL|nr:hypothetical protein [Brevibacillus panacihumi]EST56513.1 hypothetical protein T458_04275 [Brevibacillus panacihumi W25]
MLIRSLMRIVATGGIVALIGYLMAPRRKRRGFSLNFNRLPFSMKDVNRMVKSSRKLIRAMAR